MSRSALLPSTSVKLEFGSMTIFSPGRMRLTASSLGLSQRLAKAGTARIFSQRTAPCLANSSPASAICARAALIRAWYWRPAAVSSTPREVRSNSCTPSHSSSSFTWRPMAGWVTCRALDAAT
ncbi:hypothetical protein FQZ97_849980 [compost metagenome]